MFDILSRNFKKIYIFEMNVLCKNVHEDNNINYLKTYQKYHHILAKNL